MGAVAKLIEQLGWIRKAAIEAGIWDHVFLSFGSCLGAIREKGFIAHDNDADVGILSEKISVEQENRFYELLWDYKLFAHRHKEQRRTDNNRLLWTSLKMNKDGYKTCIWYMFEYEGLMWHSKGTDWVWKISPKMTPPPPKDIEAIGKGIPAKYFSSLVEVEWYKVAWKVPIEYGHCLDAWYANWNTPKKGGSSKEEYLLVVPKWTAPKTWHIRKR